MMMAIFLRVYLTHLALESWVLWLRELPARRPRGARKSCDTLVDRANDAHGSGDLPRRSTQITKDAARAETDEHK